MQLGFLLLEFSLYVSNFIALLDAYIAVLAPLLADLADLGLKMSNQVLKSLFLLCLLGKKLVLLVDKLLLEGVIKSGVFLVPGLASSMMR